MAQSGDQGFSFSAADPPRPPGRRPNPSHYTSDELARRQAQWEADNARWQRHLQAQRDQQAEAEARANRQANAAHFEAVLERELAEQKNQQQQQQQQQEQEQEQEQEQYGPQVETTVHNENMARRLAATNVRPDPAAGVGPMYVDETERERTQRLVNARNPIARAIGDSTETLLRSMESNTRVLLKVLHELNIFCEISKDRDADDPVAPAEFDQEFLRTEQALQAAQDLGNTLNIVRDTVTTNQKVVADLVQEKRDSQARLEDSLNDLRTALDAKDNGGDDDGSLLRRAASKAATRIGKLEAKIAKLEDEATATAIKHAAELARAESRAAADRLKLTGDEISRLRERNKELEKTAEQLRKSKYDKAEDVLLPAAQRINPNADSQNYLSTLDSYVSRVNDLLLNVEETLFYWRHAGTPKHSKPLGDLNEEPAGTALTRYGQAIFKSIDAIERQLGRVTGLADANATIRAALKAEQLLPTHDRYSVKAIASLCVHLWSRVKQVSDTLSRVEEVRLPASLLLAATAEAETNTHSLAQWFVMDGETIAKVVFNLSTLARWCVVYVGKERLSAITGGYFTSDVSGLTDNERDARNRFNEFFINSPDSSPSNAVLTEEVKTELTKAAEIRRGQLQAASLHKLQGTAFTNSPEAWRADILTNLQQMRRLFRTASNSVVASEREALNNSFDSYKDNVDTTVGTLIEENTALWETNEAVHAEAQNVLTQAQSIRVSLAAEDSELGTWNKFKQLWNSQTTFSRTHFRAPLPLFREGVIFESPRARFVDNVLGGELHDVFERAGIYAKLGDPFVSRYVAEYVLSVYFSRHRNPARELQTRTQDATAEAILPIAYYPRSFWATGKNTLQRSRESWMQLVDFAMRDDLRAVNQDNQRIKEFFTVSFGRRLRFAYQARPRYKADDRACPHLTRLWPRALHDFLFVTTVESSVQSMGESHTRDIVDEIRDAITSGRYNKSSLHFHIKVIHVQMVRTDEPVDSSEFGEVENVIDEPRLIVDWVSFPIAVGKSNNKVDADAVRLILAYNYVQLVAMTSLYPDNLWNLHVSSVRAMIKQYVQFQTHTRLSNIAFDTASLYRLDPSSTQERADEPIAVLPIGSLRSLRNTLDTWKQRAAPAAVQVQVKQGKQNGSDYTEYSHINAGDDADDESEDGDQKSGSNDPTAQRKQKRKAQQK